MKKWILLTTMVITLAIFLSSAITSKKFFHCIQGKYKPANDLSLTVYKRSDYSSSIYKNALAQLHITIETDNNEVISDTTFNSKYLNQYPSLENAVKQNIEIPFIGQKFEYLVVKYNVTYDSGDSKLQIPNSLKIQRHDSKEIQISI